jgi:hypothetical protein
MKVAPSVNSGMVIAPTNARQATRHSAGPTACHMPDLTRRDVQDYGRGTEDVWRAVKYTRSQQQAKAINTGRTSTGSIPDVITFIN